MTRPTALARLAVHIVLPLVLAIAGASTIEAQTLRKVILSLELPKDGCAEPLAVTEFALSATQVHLWFLVDDARSGDRYRARWIAGDGVQFTTTDWTPLGSGGSWCMWATIQPAASNIPLSKAGDWKAEIFRNDQLMFSANFRMVETPRPNISRVMSAASYEPLIAANGWVAILGAYFGPTTRHWLEQDFVEGNMPTSLEGVSVTIGGKNAYVAYISPSQINVLAPPNLLVSIPGPGGLRASTPMEVRVTATNGTSLAYTAPVHYDAYAFFTFNGSHIAGTHVDGSPVGPIDLYPGLSRPATPGEIIILYGTGFGSILPAAVNGSASQFGTISPPAVSIGGLPASVQFAGATSPGLYQFNVVVPDSLAGGNHPLVARSRDPQPREGVVTQDGVVLAIDAPPALPTLASLSIAATSVLSGQSTTGLITLAELAPAGGVNIQLSSNTVNARVPATIRIESGLRTGSFTIATDVVTAEQVATITATLNGTQRQAQLMLRPPEPISPFKDHNLTIRGTFVSFGRTMNAQIRTNRSGSFLVQLEANGTTSNRLLTLILNMINPASVGLTPTVVYTSTSAVYTANANFGVGTYADSDNPQFNGSILSSRLTLNATSPNAGTSVTGTLEFSTVGGTLSFPFTGTII